MIIDWPRVNKRLTGAEGGLDGAVDLGDDDLLVVLGVVLAGQVLPRGVKTLTVAAPENIIHETKLTRDPHKDH